MSHLVRTTAWATIDLDTEKGHVLVRQDWRYEWQLQAGAHPWTLRERRAFHHAADHQIWGTWRSGAVTLKTRGADAFSGRHPLVSVSFDVRWVLTAGHFRVVVTKVAPGAASPRSYVDFPARVIYLDTLDTVPHDVVTDAGASRSGFLTIPHEFGHTFPDRSGSAVPVQDEYHAGSPHLGDVDSLMNIGRNVRARHVQALAEELGALVPGTTFVP